MVKIEVILISETTLYRWQLDQPEEIKKAWYFESKKVDGNWPNKILDEEGKWKIEIDKEHECLKGVNVEYEWTEILKNDERKYHYWIYDLEFAEDTGIILDNQNKPISDKNKRRFWPDDKLTSFKKQDKKDNPNHQPPTTPTDTNYRYCFNCDKWLKKDEVNYLDVGQQPDGGSGETWNCKYCRKDLGEQVLIFRCKTHPNEILKVWGTLEGVNKEKVFYSQCPQKKRNKFQINPVMIKE